MSISGKINRVLTNQMDEMVVPDEVDQRVRESFNQFHAKKETKKMKKKILILSLAAAILIPTGAYALNGSYFANNNADLNGLVDDGVKKAVSKDQSIPIDEKITDQGVTVHFSELYVEDARVLVHYRIENEDGTLVPYEFDTTGLNVLTDGMKDGKQIENPTYKEERYEGFSVLNFIGAEEDKLPFTLTTSDGNKIDTGIADHDKPEGTIAFITSGTSLPKSINMKVDIKRIGKTSGNWSGLITIDQSKAKEATQIAR